MCVTAYVACITPYDVRLLKMIDIYSEQSLFFNGCNTDKGVTCLNSCILEILEYNLYLIHPCVIGSWSIILNLFFNMQMFSVILTCMKVLPTGSCLKKITGITPVSHFFASLLSYLRYKFMTWKTLSTSVCLWKRAFTPMSCSWHTFCVKKNFNAVAFPYTKNLYPSIQ